MKPEINGRWARIKENPLEPWGKYENEEEHPKRWREARGIRKDGWNTREGVAEKQVQSQIARVGKRLKRRKRKKSRDKEKNESSGQKRRKEGIEKIANSPR